MKRILIATLTVLPFLGQQAMAQGANPAQLQTPGPQVGVSSSSAAGASPSKPPPALPGARAEPTPVAPAAKNAMDLPPNEALFDAINRGDLAVAKDAISRGADLNAKNVLGLTPIELSVDLGRNQLSFYLLSLRGPLPNGSPSVAQRTAAAKPPTRAERLAAERAARADKAHQASTIADATPAGPQTARLFSGNGGQPNPQAGFLGFNALR